MTTTEHFIAISLSVSKKNFSVINLLFVDNYYISFQVISILIVSVSRSTMGLRLFNPFLFLIMEPIL